MTFSLDLVRDSVQSDLTNFLGKIEDQAHALSELPLAWPAGSALETIGIQCHGIVGTTSLVGLTSLSSSARLLENLAEIGKEFVAELELMAARTRDLSGLYLDGVAALRTMLAHELAGNSGEAGRLSAQLNERIEVAQAGDLRLSTPTVDVGPPASSVAARMVPAIAPRAPAPTANDVPAELAAIFREEAREALVTMRELMRALAHAPSAAATEPIERLFHTLKGAAATVGLAEVAELAKVLQLRLAAAADGDETIDADFVADIGRDATWWFELAGVPDGALVAGGDAPLAVFRKEAARLLSALDLGETIDRAATARTLHLVKGSALVVGAADFAADVVAVEAMVANQLDARSISEAVTALHGKLDPSAAPAPAPTGPGPAAVPVAVVGAIDPELWDAFQQECQELLDGIDRGILVLDDHGTTAALAPLFRQYHTLKGSVNTIGLTGVGAIVHDVEDLLETLIEANAPRTDKAVVEALLEAQRLIKKGLGQARQGYLELDRRKLDARLRSLALAGAGGPASDAASGPGSASASASADPDSIASVASGSDGSAGTLDHDGRRYVRVPLDRLDALMNLAGELVIGRSRLVERSSLLRGIQRELGVGRQRLVETVDRFSAEHEFANLDGKNRRALATRDGEAGFSALELDRYDDVHVLSRSLTELSTDFREMDSELVRELHNFHEDADRLGTIVSNLQGEITRARMIAVETLFARLRLPIRDAAERERKEVRVTTSGEDVALDKSIADALFAPLLHLVRNAVGHGIERAEVRATRGKPAVGTIHLAARQESGQIVIEIADDGAGLDRAALRSRGVALGLVSPDVPLDDPAITELVFAAGLSTAATVDAVAGRGVGGNVVKRAVDRLGGSVRVKPTAVGTAFTITLPMTLAITRAVIARSGDLQLAVPLSFAHRIRDAADVTVVESAGVRRIAEGDGYLTITSLAQLLEQPASGKPAGYVVVRLGDEALALEVDAVIGQEEIVVKPLGTVLDGHELFAGVTFRGTGDLALILDVPGLIERSGGARVAPVRATEPIAAPAVASDSVAPLAPAMPLPALPAPMPVVPVATRLRVLFIDDSVSVRKVAERTLRDLGVEVTVANDGVDGLERLRAGGFDLVFTDLEMPRMHGYDLLREIRYVPAYADLPVIVVSSRSGTKHQDQARTLGATDYITKPFSSESLAAVLTKWGRRE